MASFQGDVGALCGIQELLTERSTKHKIHILGLILSQNGLKTVWISGIKKSDHDIPQKL